MTTLLQQAINEAINSGNYQKVLEGTVANAILKANIACISFNKEVGLNDSIGEIDVETALGIVEVTTQTSRKLKQIQKLISNPDLNPGHKPVILYAPNYKITSARDIINAGAYVVRNEDELIHLLRKLGE